MGEHARNLLVARLTGAVIKEFAANAATEGRWTPENLAFEAKGKVGRLALKLIEGKGQVSGLRPAPITASDRLEQTPEVQAARRAEQASMPYAALGADNGVYYYVDRLDQVRSFNAKALEQSSTLNELASPDHWMQHFGGEKGSYNVSAAANTLMEQARECGVYTADDVQGRGVSNRIQIRPLSLPIVTPLAGADVALCWAVCDWDGAVGKWPAGATVESLA